MAMAQPPSLSRDVMAAGNLDTYLIHSRLEIASVLRAIVAKKTPIAVHLDEGKDFIVSSALAIDDRGQALVFDYGPDRKLNTRAVACDSLLFVTNDDQVTVQFVSRHAAPTEYEGKGALRVPLPEQLLRLQRREYYRIASPAVNPLKCVITTTRNGAAVPLEPTVLNIGCGGIASYAKHDDPALEVGARHPCMLVLPGVGTIHTRIELRSKFEITLSNGAKARRVGYQFVGLPEKTRALIQRYILQQGRGGTMRRAPA